MKKLLLSSFLLFIAFSCKKEEPQPNNPGTGTITQNNYIEFTVDGQRHVGVNNSVVIMKYNNGADGYYFALTSTTTEQMTPDTKMAQVQIHNAFQLTDSTYTIPNYEEMNESDCENGMSYMIGASTSYMDASCDANLQGGSNAGTPGKLIVTSINPSTKKISGTFSMTLCKGPGETVALSGKFVNYTYQLVE